MGVGGREGAFFFPFLLFPVYVGMDRIIKG